MSLYPLFGLVLEPTWLYETRPAPSSDRLLLLPAPPYVPQFVRPSDEYVGIVLVAVALAAVVFAAAADVDAEVDAEADVDCD